MAAPVGTDRHTNTLTLHQIRFDGLRPALEGARLAPSAHNSQPWRLRIGSDAKTVKVGWDPARRLPHGDPQARYLYTGLGAAVESMLLVAGAGGLLGELEPADVPGSSHVTTVRFLPGTPPLDERLLAAQIALRKTTRLPFRLDPLAENDIVRLQGESERGGCQLAVVTEFDAISLVADAIAEGTARNFADAAVFDEFTEWLRFSSDQRPDGLTLDALELRGLDAFAARLALHPARMRLLRRLRLHRRAARTQRRLAIRTPAFCLLTAPACEPSAMLGHGRTMLRVWLRASQLGLRLHPMTAAMDHADTLLTLAQAFGIRVDDTPVLCFRLGYADVGAHSARLPLDAIVA